MKQKMKKFLGLALTLLVAFPILANAQIKAPTKEQINQLTKDYYEKFGKDVSEYDQKAYLLFPEFYRGSELKEVIPSFLAQQIWKKYKECGSPLNSKAIWSSYLAFYDDLKWHEAQGITYDQAAEMEYANVPNNIRKFIYKPSVYSEPRFLFTLSDQGFSWLYEGLDNISKENNDEDLFINYKKNVYYDLFTIDNFVANRIHDYYDRVPCAYMEGISEEEYVAVLVRTFNKDWQWEKFAVDMPKNLLKDMQDNVAKHVPSVCAEQTDRILAILSNCDRYFEDADPKKLCEGFIEHAKKYGLWNRKAQKKYRKLKLEKIERNISKAFEDIDMPQYTLPKY